MADNNKLVPQTKGLTIQVSNEGVPEEIRLQELRQAIQSTDIPFREKRRLIRQEVEATLKYRKAQIDAMLRTEEKRLRHQEHVAEAAILLQKEKVIYEIRDAFSKTLTTLGMRVNLEQLKIITEYGEQITRFKRDLRKKDLDKNKRNAIIKAADNSFNAMQGQLGRLADEIFRKSEEVVD